jgi:hypothetical protein
MVLEQAVLSALQCGNIYVLVHRLNNKPRTSPMAYVWVVSLHRESGRACSSTARDCSDVKIDSAIHHLLKGPDSDLVVDRIDMWPGIDNPHVIQGEVFQGDPHGSHAHY